MKAIVHGFKVEIFPSDEEIHSICKMGQGKESCAFLMMGDNGFECGFYNRKSILDFIRTIERGEAGEFNDQRMGCDTIKNWKIPFQLGEVNIEV